MVLPGDERITLGSLSAITGRISFADIHLPDWLEDGTEPTLRYNVEDEVRQTPQAPVPRSIGSSSSRNTPVVLTPSGSSPAGSYTPQGSTSKPIPTNLDKFYDDIHTDEEEEEGDEDESDEEGESEGEEEGEEEVEDSEEEQSSEHEIDDDGEGENTHLHDQTKG